MTETQQTPPEGEVTGDVVVEIDHVSKTFPGQRALDDVSVELRAGEVHALLGENGSGKSTLIKVLAGSHLPDRGGAVRVNGEPLTLGTPSASFAAGLRFVHQKGAVIPELSAIENFAIETGYTRPGLIDWKAERKRAEELLRRFNVSIDVNVPLSRCRAVDRAAVAIARALRTDDESALTAIVLDEPTASLPEAEVRQLFELIEDVTKAGVAILYVSHRMDEIFEIADRVTVLRDGRLRGTEPIEGLTRETLVNLIVGREIAEGAAVAERHAGGRETKAEVAMSVRGLSGERLRGIDFDLHRGEILGVVGLAGSGREDLAQTLIGARADVEGGLTVDGNRLKRIAPDTVIEAGLVLGLSNTQEASAIPLFNVRENVTLPSLASHRGATGLSRHSERSKVASWADALDIRPRDTERSYGMLSGGNQQKVILAKWLNAEPRILVLDEPTAGVDVGARQAISELLFEQAEAGLSILICTSDYEDVVSVCDAAIVIRNGLVVDRLERGELTEETLLMAAAGSETENDDQAGNGVASGS